MITICYLEAALMWGDDSHQDAMFSYLSPEPGCPETIS